MKVLLKVSPQNQITLRKDLRSVLGSCSHVEVEAVKDHLILRPAVAMSVERAQEIYGRHGFTAEVLKEALAIVRRRGEVSKD